MKVVAINGSPHRDGNCARSLELVGGILRESGIEFEVLQVGDKVVRGCMACGQCGKTRDGRCAFGEAPDPVNEAIARMREADGIILASPVHYSGVAGTMKAFLDRAFYVAGSSGGLFRHKVGAALVAVRRSGGSSTLDTLNHYLSYSEMVVATSNYWNIVHGMGAGEVEEDAEGLQILEVLARNMAWILKMREATKGSIEPPARERKVITSFIR
jgi:multimeric flavodoxin WrbA